MDPKKLVVPLILLLAFSVAVKAQKDFAFKVLVNKGKNEMKSSGGWQQIKVGVSLQSSDELRIPENSYLGLVHVTGKPLEVKHAGTYKVATLASKVGTGTSVLNKYTDFILSSSATPKNRLSATGAVHRGPNNIKVYLPPTDLATVYNSKVIINWETTTIKGPFVVTFNNMFGDELNQIEVPGDHLMINLDSANFQGEKNILVKVHSKPDKNKVSEVYTIKKLSKADKDRITKSLDEIANETAEENALNKLILAGFYEQQNLLIDAVTVYQQAIKLAPDVPFYKEAYSDFLLRNSIKELPAKK